MKGYNLFNYIEYLKDNPKGYWFKRRLYGWGWVPATWQGWLTIFIFIGFLILNGIWLASKGEVPNKIDWIFFFATLIISVSVLIFICYKKGEKPKWSWGRNQ